MLGVTGLLIAMLPFVASLAPGPRAKNALPAIDVSQLLPGQYVVHDAHLEKLFVVRTPWNEIKVYGVPFTHGHYLMPDLNWWKGFMPCRSFGPELSNGRLEAGAVFRCWDKDKQEPWWTETLVWDLHGKNKKGVVPDLLAPRYEVAGDKLIIYPQSR